MKDSTIKRKSTTKRSPKEKIQSVFQIFIFLIIFFIVSPNKKFDTVFIVNIVALSVVFLILAWTDNRDPKIKASKTQQISLLLALGINQILQICYKNSVNHSLLFSPITIYLLIHPVVKFIYKRITDIDEDLYIVFIKDAQIKSDNITAQQGE